MKKYFGTGSGSSIVGPLGFQQLIGEDDEHDKILLEELNHGGSERLLITMSQFLHKVNENHIIAASAPDLADFSAYVRENMPNFHSNKGNLAWIRKNISAEFRKRESRIPMAWLQENLPHVLAAMNNFLTEVNFQPKERFVTDEVAPQVIYSEEEQKNRPKSDGEQISQALGQPDKKKKDEGRVKEELSQEFDARGHEGVNAGKSQANYVRPGRVGKKGVIVYMPDETVEKLKIIAKVRGESLQQYLADFLKNHAEANTSPEALRSAAVSAANEQIEKAQIRLVERIAQLADTDAPKLKDLIANRFSIDK